jgi:exodeoxyribonuclease VII small subunit
MKKPEKTFTYEEAFAELQTIVSEIELGDTSIDELAEKVKRATQLMDICKRKLTDTEINVQKILEDLTPKDQDESK